LAITDLSAERLIDWLIFWAWLFVSLVI
jgi:hypothetical protein